MEVLNRGRQALLVASINQSKSCSRRCDCQGPAWEGANPASVARSRFPVLEFLWETFRPPFRFAIQYSNTPYPTLYSKDTPPRLHGRYTSVDRHKQTNCLERHLLRRSVQPDLLIMPRSKRARVVHLTKVEKKGKELSQKLFANVQEAASANAYVYVFSVENMRNNYLKEVRSEFADSRIFFGKTKVMAKALGTDEASEHLPGLSKLTTHMKGDVGLLCTPRPPTEILPYFNDLAQLDFARAGTQATQKFTIPSGVVYSRGGEIPIEDDVPLPHSMEVTIRKWGMPTRLDKGKIILNEDYTVCNEGQTLTSHQTALLKTFGVAMAEFRVKVEAYWQASDGTVEVVPDTDADENMS